MSFRSSAVPVTPWVLFRAVQALSQSWEAQPCAGSTGLGWHPQGPVPTAPRLFLQHKLLCAAVG